MACLYMLQVKIKFRLIRNLFMLSMRIWMHAGSLESTKDV